MTALASYASDPARSKGRRHPEPEAPTRNDFQRDRDRILHTTAFRRLEYKTQVFLNGSGDHLRTRLTHTMEVAGIARNIARALRLNEHLTEAIALAHDLGHPPFGHNGESELNALAAGIGGARFMEIPGVGHCPQIEDPQAFVAAVNGFLPA